MYRWKREIWWVDWGKGCEDIDRSKGSYACYWYQNGLCGRQAQVKNLVILII